VVPILCKNKSESKNRQFQFLERIRIKEPTTSFGSLGGKKDEKSKEPPVLVSLKTFPRNTSFG